MNRVKHIIQSLFILSFLASTWGWAQDRGMGLEPLTPEKIAELEKAYAQYIGGGEELYNLTLKDVGTPTARRFDLREVNALTPVRNQQSCGSCWAFSAIASIESSNLIINGSSPDLSEQQLVNCVDYPMKGVGGCNGGNYSMAFQWLLDTDKSLKLENQLPYQNAQTSCTIQNLGELRVASWKSIGRNPSMNEIKNAIVKHGALAAAMNASSSSVLDYNPKEKLLMDDPNTGKVSHAINVVGWDDDKGAWLIKNSWGKYWGEDGYGWIKYGTQDISSYSWVDVTKLDTPPSPAPKVNPEAKVTPEAKEEIAEEEQDPVDSEKKLYTLDLVQVLGSIQEYQEMYVVVNDHQGKRFGMNKKGTKYHNKIEIEEGKHDLVIYTKSVVKRKGKKAMLFGFYTDTIEIEGDKTLKVSYAKKKVKEPNVYSLTLSKDDIMPKKK
jgi:hypothetical protein